ncbi:conserved hypothetical protein [Talaromyces stipitatus ATCC 10500]|uniref:FAD-binding FR-type domain-containing protein n=1 Tax=Talaromyces stipitatus (strain ATCC 10500 / CBS 375.48 / QM 6759 / NRRL 1006) TaxID=441959 RepID=B8LU36_TALSN|nr:uncharacterized protein TSTA_060060 [Talaromyces stipitatus ATCC 10500]EED22508.1 conserved hypothetical protein [Talaromyces stipitatus ATCC 10500]
MAPLGDIDISQAYSLTVGCIVIFLLTFRLSHTVFHYLYPRLKHLVHRLSLPRPRSRLSGVLPKDWSRIALLAIYLGGTVASNVIYVSTLAEASSRAAKLCLANVVPLMVCSHEVGAHLFGVSLDLFHSVHRLLGTMAFLQGLAHGVYEVASAPVHVHDGTVVYGISASIIFASLMLSSVFKARVYEFFSQSHRACALGLVFATWRHTYNKSALSTWCIAGAAAAYALTFLIQILRIAVRNLAFARRAECLINHQGNNLEVIVFPARPWTVRAGERVNLSIPSAGLMSVFQMHPFVITWWDNNELGKLESFTLLVKPRSGFTNKLKMLPSTRHRAWIDGPYGPDRALGTPISDYGHIFMVATGIGVGAQIPYIKQLLEGYRRGVVRTQKIVLIWQMDLEADYDDVQDWLQELVSQDSGYVSGPRNGVAYLLNNV